MTEPGTGHGTVDRAWYRFRDRISLVVPVPVRVLVPDYKGRLVRQKCKIVQIRPKSNFYCNVTKNDQVISKRYVQFSSINIFTVSLVNSMFKKYDNMLLLSMLHLNKLSQISIFLNEINLVQKSAHTTHYFCLSAQYLLKC